MTRARYVRLVLLAPVLVGLGACASLGGAPAPADAEAIAARVQAVGIAPDLVYVTDLDGFDLAAQSVGVMGNDGMSATYTRVDGATMATVTLTTSRPTDPQPDPAPVPCADLPDADAPVLACQVERGEALVRLDGQGVDAATLRAAGKAVRVPGAGELDTVFADVPEEIGPPVERGDLPEHGDGAPINPTGEGG
ncbi:hypothetical protein [Cellulomonas wangsupingiae]|uniref:Membrane lipoprotein n=1 Tax=Cellulomonas wangsupingiae TaxID=2968085 RepID=A0ABY5K569_9CELL|nr:hypothetical protein [Cellulomonas wangsupingiae]MCC2334982.1 hypothetical protein [Cellulomonas wangsupingiae]UUI65480.1 hypothetical protein NP075_01685 [Cellulomonas wangsupingiae]